MCGLLTVHVVDCRTISGSRLSIGSSGCRSQLWVFYRNKCPGQRGTVRGYEYSITRNGDSEARNSEKRLPRTCLLAFQQNNTLHWHEYGS